MPQPHTIRRRKCRGVVHRATELNVDVRPISSRARSCRRRRPLEFTLASAAVQASLELAAIGKGRSTRIDQPRRKRKQAMALVKDAISVSIATSFRCH
jgi:hypothetical protein